MGYIREPEGVDFLIQSRSLTVEEEKTISEFIQADKAKHKAQSSHKPERNRDKKHYMQDVSHLGVQQNSYF